MMLLKGPAAEAMASFTARRGCYQTLKGNPRLEGQIAVYCVAGKDLNLAEDFFKLGHLLEAGLLRKRDLIEDAGNAALKEEAIEIRLASIAGEWSELMLTFQEYKTRGPVVLKVNFSPSLPEFEYRS